MVEDKKPNKQKIIEFIVQKAYLEHPPDVAANLSLGELGLDSLGVVELSMLLEDHFDLILDIEELKPETQLGILVDKLLSSK